jgi:glycosyltransferase involved in cell wall biosynthesis
MKIAYFLGTFKKEDGVTRVLLALIRENQKRGIESIIITGWSEDSSIVSVPIIEVPSFIFPFYKEYKIPYPGISGFEKKLCEFNPDIIHVHSPDPASWAAVKYDRKYKIPIVATHHTNFFCYLPYYHASFLKPIVWYGLRKFYKKMDFTTTPSNTTRDELAINGIPNVYALPWGVETDKFNPLFYSKLWREKILKIKEENIILYVGRLTWEKDLRTLANTYNLLKAKQNNFRMVIVGDGPARSELESLMPGAFFTGHLEKEELSTAYASSDIFLFPSSTETFGNVTIEAMASGIVSVVANSGGSKSIIKDGQNGLLAEPRNEKDFYEKVVLLLKDRKLREQFRNNGLETTKNYTWLKVSDNLIKKYSKLIS